jgi:hypothetical protein
MILRWSTIRTVVRLMLKAVVIFEDMHEQMDEDYKVRFSNLLGSQS